MMEHIVSRSALQSPASTPELASNAEVTARLKDLNDFEYVGHENGHAENPENEEQLDFRLFATTQTKPGEESRKIRLKSPTPTFADPSFTQPNRDLSYYFAGPLSDSNQLQLENAAVAGQQVIARSSSPWPGSAYSWKVTRLPVTSLSGSIPIDATASTRVLKDEATSSERKRPGKKSRIKLRVKLASQSCQQETLLAATASKEAAEREKKTRRNREKKAKKKMREKAKKAAAGGGGEASGSESSSDDDADSAPG